MQFFQTLASGCAMMLRKKRGNFGQEEAAVGLKLCQRHTITNMRKAAGDSEIDGIRGTDITNISAGKMVQMLLNLTHMLAEVQTTQDLRMGLGGMIGMLSEARYPSPAL